MGYAAGVDVVPPGATAVVQGRPAFLLTGAAVRPVWDLLVQPRHRHLDPTRPLEAPLDAVNANRYAYAGDDPSTPPTPPGSHFAALLEAGQPPLAERLSGAEPDSPSVDPSAPRLAGVWLEGSPVGPAPVALKRVGFGFRNFTNYRLRLLLHCGITWHTDRTPQIR